MTSKILAFAGSTRTDSFNKKLIRVAVKGAEAAGAEVTLIDLRDLPMPRYDGDLEEKEGVPPNGRRLKELMKSHSGFLLSCPEYNSSITGVLKNAIDWASREEEGEKPLVCFRGKTAALMSASPGVLVLPDQAAGIYRFFRRLIGLMARKITTATMRKCTVSSRKIP